MRLAALVVLFAGAGEGEASPAPPAAPSPAAPAALPEGHPPMGGGARAIAPADAARMSGIPLLSPDLPAGTLTVRIALGGLTETLPGAEVELLVVDGASVSRRRATADDSGRARFEALPPGARVTAAAVARGETFATPPFEMPRQGGARMLLYVPKEGGTTTGRSALRVSPRSHIIVEPGDEDVEIVEVVEIENGGDRAFDPGPEGLSIWLPEGQKHAATGGDAPPEVKVEDGRLVWRGPVPPGAHAVRFFFRRKPEGDRIAIRQRTDVAWPDVAVVVRDAPGIAVEGPGVSGGDARDLGGQKFRVFRGDGKAAGGTIAFTVTGLPRPDTTARNVASVLALTILGWAMVAAWRRAPAAPGEEA